MGTTNKDIYITLQDTNAEEPLVSVCVITYQHARYIRNCLNGILMQETNFPFEVIINDDASTDGTTEIIKEYENKYPYLIVPVYHTENEYSQGLRGIHARNTFPIARGKYIALCDGDDYWTDPLKLQKQVDFLEANEDYNLTCGGYSSNYNGVVTTHIETGIVPQKHESEQGFTFTLNDIIEIWLTKTLTVLFRKSIEVNNELIRYKYRRDLHLFYLLLKWGKGFYFKEVFGVYNMHEAGIFSLKSDVDKIVSHYYIYQELYTLNHDEYSRRLYISMCSRIISYRIKGQIKNNQFKSISLLKESIRLIKTKRDVIAFIKPFVPKPVRRLLHKLSHL